MTVTYAGAALPADIAGQYDEAFDCTQDEGGASFEGVDSSHCFRKNDGSSWRIWNTGCGWEYGLRVENDISPTGTEWERHARTYSGQCAAMPDSQLGIEALTTDTFYDSFGDPIYGLSSSGCE